MDDKQGSHTVVRRPADSRPVEKRYLHLRLADSRRMEGLLLKTHNALSPADLMRSVGRTLCGKPDLPSAVSQADLMQSVGRTLCSKSDLPSAVSPADLTVSVGLILLDNFRINPRTVHINYFLF